MICIYRQIIQSITTNYGIIIFLKPPFGWFFCFTTQPICGFALSLYKMRQLLSILLLLSVSYQFTAKMGVILWYSANIDYVATELCENKDKPQMQCNGKCYLKKQLDKVDDKQDKEQAPTKKLKTELPEFITTSYSIVFSTIFSEKKNTNSFYQNLYRYTAMFAIFHPPNDVC